jgi:hypothetical protein
MVPQSAAIAANLVDAIDEVAKVDRDVGVGIAKGNRRGKNLDHCHELQLRQAANFQPVVSRGLCSIEPDDFDPLVDPGDVLLRQSDAQDVADLAHEAILEVLPIALIIDLRVHPGKRSGHGRSSKKREHHPTSIVTTITGREQAGRSHSKWGVRDRVGNSEMELRFTIRQMLLANIGLSASLAWLLYLFSWPRSFPPGAHFDRDSTYRTQLLITPVVALGIPALMICAAVVLGNAEIRHRAVKASLAFHCACMSLMCAAPALLLAYYRISAIAVVVPPHRWILRLAIAPCIIMSVVYGAGFLASIRRGRAAAPTRNGSRTR